MHGRLVRLRQRRPQLRVFQHRLPLLKEPHPQIAYSGYLTVKTCEHSVHEVLRLPERLDVRSRSSQAGRHRGLSQLEPYPRDVSTLGELLQGHLLECGVKAAADGEAEFRVGLDPVGVVMQVSAKELQLLWGSGGDLRRDDSITHRREGLGRHCCDGECLADAGRSHGFPEHRRTSRLSKGQPGHGYRVQPRVPRP